MEQKFDEEAVLYQLKQDDNLAFEAIYRHFWELLFNQAYNKLRNEDEAKELVQDVFAELWLKRRTLAIRSSLAGYLQTALRFKVLNHIKAAIVREKYAASIKQNKFVSHDHADENIHYVELHDALHAALQLLPAQPRRVYELRQYQGLSYAEIADSLRISISTVEKHMIKALKYIRARLSKFNT